MKCPRCGKDNPPSIHTCTAPPAIYLAEQIEAVYEAPLLPRKAAAELRRLYEENVRLTEALKMAHLEYAGCMEDLKEAEKQQDHFRDATEKVDCPRCGHCCPDDTELRQLREQNLMLDAEAAKDEALLRQALDLIEAWERGCDHADYWFEIAALRERLKS
jgi:hypothetical protein